MKVVPEVLEEIGEGRRLGNDIRGRRLLLPPFFELALRGFKVIPLAGPVVTLPLEAEVELSVFD